MPAPTYTFEKIRLADYRLIGGVDEAGRGPLAGPVVAACVILDPGAIGEKRTKKKWWYEVKDSKQISEPKRKFLAQKIKEHALGVGVGIVEPEEIDALNIHRASLKAMHRAVITCAIKPRYLLIDGLYRIPELSIPQQPIVQGDAQVLSIACASIIAKVERDALMCSLHVRFPAYGFNVHKGYPTRMHRTCLAEHGPCPAHRKRFIRTAQRAE